MIAGSFGSTQCAANETRVQALLTRLIAGIERRFERRRQADIVRLNGPLNFDEAWAGGWYGRSREVQDGLMQRHLNAGGKAPPEPNTRDHILD